MQTLDPRSDARPAALPDPAVLIGQTEPEPTGAPLASLADPARSVARNTLILLVQQMITFAMTFVWTVVVQWYLHKDHYGELFYAQSLAWIGAVFIDAGVATYLTKQVARDRAGAGRLLSNAVMLRAGGSLLVYGAILGVAAAMGKGGEELLAVALVGLSIVVASFTQACAATFQGHETMLWPALGTIAEKVTVTVFSVVLLLMGYGLIAVAAVLLGGAAMNLLLVGTRALRAGWLRLHVDLRLIRQLVVGGAPFFLWAAFGVIYQRNAAIQLEAQDPASEGPFGVAVRMYETLSFVPYIFQVAVLPVLARTFVQAGDAMGQTARRSLDLIVLAALPMGVGVFLLAPEVVGLTAGRPMYEEAIIPLRILGISLIPLYVDMILSAVLISADKQRQWALVAVGAALVNPVLNWWLIHQTQSMYQNGAIGSAVVTFLTELAIFAIYVRMVPRGVLTGRNLGYAGRVGLAAGLMGAAILLVLPVLEDLAPDGGTGRGGAAVVLIGAALVAGAVFGGAALVLRLVGPDELGLLRKALRRGAA